MKAILMILLALLVGCNNIEDSAIQQVSDTKMTEESGSRYCVMTTTDEEDGRYLMIDRLFTEQDIPCETNADCYEFLLITDEYRELAPEFEPYLDCEETRVEVNR